MKPVLSPYGRLAGGAHLHPFAYRSIAATHPGCVRALNEDACLDRPEIGLWAIADGMGGHQAGDVASALVVSELNRVDAFESAFAFRSAVAAALCAANAQLQAKAEVELADLMGATVVTLLVHGVHYACLWAGDSRAYLLREGRLHRLTRDHTLVEHLVGSGELKREEARAHASAHVVTRAVGAHSKLDLDGVFGRTRPGDRFLLCSDGLGVVDDALIARELDLASLSVCATRLVRQTLAAGAPDNVSVVLVDCHAA